jgi:hypothetical protein
LKQRSLDKLHSLYFPYQWQEAVVQPERLLLINGKLNTQEQVRYWSERYDVFREDLPEEVIRVENGKVVNSSQQIESIKMLDAKREEHFDEVT